MPGSQIKNIAVDASKIPRMECWCGSNKFIQVFELKYISSMLVGDPKGATVATAQWACLKCFTYYPCAIPQEEVEKRRPKDDDADIAIKPEDSKCHIEPEEKWPGK